MSFKISTGKGVFLDTIFIPIFKAISIYLGCEWPVTPAIIG